MIRAVDLLAQLDISREFQKYVSASIYFCNNGSFRNTLFIAPIGFPAPISFYYVCVVSFYFFLVLFVLVFLWSLLLAEV